ncbi:ABC transporter permease subunit [Pyrococcus kukulkanii]|uniref:ABC transporter permease subunit n=1 Tax=Pyrococcus kukulkanii TaxID=1609559 RepID=UPI0035664A63
MKVPWRGLSKIMGIYLVAVLVTIIIAGAAGAKLAKNYASEALGYIKATNPEFYNTLKENATKMGISVEEYYYRLILSRVSKSDNVLSIGIGMLKKSREYLHNTPNLNIGEAVKVTIIIISISLILIVLSGVYIGLKFRGSKSIDIISRFFVGIPSWWLGTIFIIILAVKLDLIPLGSAKISPSYYIFAILVLVFIHAWEIASYVSHESIKELKQPYINAEKAKGVPENVILWRHVLKNISIALSSITFQKFSDIFIDFIAVDVLFGLGGLGSLLKWSFIREIDPPYGIVVQFNYHLFFVVTFIMILLFMAFSMGIEVIKGILDPRVSTNER